MKQQPLNLASYDDNTFERFYEGQWNTLALAQIQHWLVTSNEHVMFVHGATGAGLSHILQACCHQVQQMGKGAVYLPLQELLHYDPATIFDSLEHVPLMCLDDFDAILGMSNWETALFQLFNNTQDARTKLLIAAKLPPLELPIARADLTSRLSWGDVVRLSLPDDDGLIELLLFWASLRGLVLDKTVAQYIAHHSERNPAALKHIMEQLDEASFVAKRRLTVPFVKEILGF